MAHAALFSSVLRQPTPCNARLPSGVASFADFGSMYECIRASMDELLPSSGFSSYQTFGFGQG